MGLCEQVILLCDTQNVREVTMRCPHLVLCTSLLGRQKLSWHAPSLYWTSVLVTVVIRVASPVSGLGGKGWGEWIADLEQKVPPVCQQESENIRNTRACD